MTLGKDLKYNWRVFYCASPSGGTKFWQIRKEEDFVFYTLWGKVGKGGQQKYKHFPSKAIRDKEYEKIINQKKDKGYKENIQPEFQKNIENATGKKPNYDNTKFKMAWPETTTSPELEKIKQAISEQLNEKLKDIASQSQIDCIKEIQAEYTEKTTKK